MKKQDVFEKMVEKVSTDGWSGDMWAVGTGDAVTLLRRHHARVRKAIMKLWTIEIIGGDSGMYIKRDVILAALDALAGKKGTR